MTTPAETIFAKMALEHLMMITANTDAPEVQLHCHFARTFLRLAIDDQRGRQLSSLTFDPLPPLPAVPAPAPPPFAGDDGTSCGIAGYRTG